MSRSINRSASSAFASTCSMRSRKPMFTDPFSDRYRVTVRGTCDNYMGVIR